MKVLKTMKTWRKLPTNFSVFWRGTLIIGIPIVCLIASTLIIAGLRSNTIVARQEEEQKRQVLEITESVMKELLDAETGVRGFGLTGQDEFLNPYFEARQNLPLLLEQLKKEAANTPESEEIQKIQVLAQEQIELLEENLATLDEVDPVLGQQPEITQQLIISKSHMDSLRSQIADFSEQEGELQQLREEKVLEWRNLTTNVQWLVLVVSLMAGAAAIYLFYLLDHELSARTKTLQENNLRLNAVFENVVDGILLLDQQGYIESCNSSAASIFDCEEEDLSGTHLQQWILESDSISNSGEVFQFFLGKNQEKLYRFQEVLGKCASGSIFTMELAISKLKWDDHPYHFLAIVRDITERKESEATLLKQARLLDLANDSIVVRDLNDRLTYWNQGAEHLYGWTEKEALGHNIHQLLQTEFPQPLEEIEAELSQKGEWSGELNHTTKAGNHLTVASSWTLQGDESANSLAKLEINKDITEAKIAEKALRKSEELYRTLLENFPNGAVFLFDADLRYTLAAGTSLGRVHLRSEDIVGKTLGEAVTPENAKRLEPLYRSALAGVSSSTEISFGDRVYSVYVLPVKDNENVLLGMVMTQDITESKNYEENLRSRAEELAKTTSILANTTRVLEKRNKELDQFAYIVSHDLKAPLRAIANLSSWIEEDIQGELNEDTQRQMDLLRGRVHRMEALIEGLLQYSRVGRIKLEPSIVNVGELLDEIVDSLDPPPNVTVTIASEMPTLETEVIPLQQVFSNLISNAIKHNDKSQGKVVISVVEREEDYEFAVADNGPGIEADYHDKVFVMFQTLQPRDQVENTGVGLAIVKKIIEDKGGTIRLESEVGQGTTVYFTWQK